MFIYRLLRLAAHPCGKWQPEIVSTSVNTIISDKMHVTFIQIPSSCTNCSIAQPITLHNIVCVMRHSCHGMANHTGEQHVFHEHYRETSQQYFYDVGSCHTRNQSKSNFNPFWSDSNSMLHPGSHVDAFACTCWQCPYSQNRAGLGR